MLTSRYWRRILFAFYILLSLGLLVTSAAHAGSDQSRIQGQEQITHQYLYFPEGIKIPSDIIEQLPSWIVLNSDGTLPQRIKLPNDHGIPRELKLPERFVEIPVFNDDGSVTYTEDGEMVHETIKVSAMSYDLESVLSRQGLESSSRNLLEMASYSSGSIAPYYVSVRLAWSGHCDQGTNYAKFSPTSNMTNFHAGSYLNTWVPGDGAAYNWDFTLQGPNVTNTTLCIPKSLYWVHIAPYGGANPPVYYALLAAYNYTGSWWMTYD